MVSYSFPFLIKLQELQNKPTNYTNFNELNRITKMTIVYMPLNLELQDFYWMNLILIQFFVSINSYQLYIKG
ncbi:unnamed protein product [Paramecium sonneborni]|uniref:Uncharacterized protein n=1 Tax=Paramecium sonneborni TaxID=65129 RepID=A0A8S1RGJ7_9CILI|nr:unnamed protein product [Paramecium sonneborni]